MAGIGRITPFRARELMRTAHGLRVVHEAGFHGQSTEVRGRNWKVYTLASMDDPMGGGAAGGLPPLVALGLIHNHHHEGPTIGLGLYGC